MARALDGIKLLLLDMDGVVYRGETAIAGSARAIANFRKMGKKIFFITNNSANSRPDYVRKLKRMGIAAKKSEIITSGFATSIYLKENFPDARVYVVGEGGLVQELREAGLRIVSMPRAESATHVVVGLDRGLSYGKIDAGLRALSSGAEFIATNDDPTYPIERGIAPGAGATIGALSGCSGKKPRMTFGKPARYMVNLAMDLARAKAKETAIIGDRIDTDIAVGRKLGLRTILVLSGIAKRSDVERAKGTRVYPAFVFKNIEEVSSG